MKNAKAEMMMVNGRRGVGISIDGCSYEEAKELAMQMMASINAEGENSPLLNKCGKACCEKCQDIDEIDDEDYLEDRLTRHSVVEVVDEDDYMTREELHRLDFLINYARKHDGEEYFDTDAILADIEDLLDMYYEYEDVQIMLNYVLD